MNNELKTRIQTFRHAADELRRPWVFLPPVEDAAAGPDSDAGAPRDAFN